MTTIFPKEFLRTHHNEMVSLLLAAKRETARNRKMRVEDRVRILAYLDKRIAEERGWLASFQD